MQEILPVLHKTGDPLADGRKLLAGIGILRVILLIAFHPPIQQGHGPLPELHALHHGGIGPHQHGVLPGPGEGLI
jgi:hypothetical protein